MLGRIWQPLSAGRRSHFDKYQDNYSISAEKPVIYFRADVFFHHSDIINIDYVQPFSHKYGYPAEYDRVFWLSVIHIILAVTGIA